jgi:hypothetical protein
MNDETQLYYFDHEEQGYKPADESTPPGTQLFVARDGYGMIPAPTDATASRPVSPEVDSPRAESTTGDVTGAPTASPSTDETRADLLDGNGTSELVRIRTVGEDGEALIVTGHVQVDASGFLRFTETPKVEESA